jgi:hypothetical protein
MDSIRPNAYPKYKGLCMCLIKHHGMQTYGISKEVIFCIIKLGTSLR